MEPAGNFASCIKSGNHISIPIQHLRLLIDLDAAHAIMCANPELIAIEGAFNLILRDDVDHQAEAAYACMSDGTILITANLFLQSISSLLSNRSQKDGTVPTGSYIRLLSQMQFRNTLILLRNFTADKRLAFPASPLYATCCR